MFNISDLPIALQSTEKMKTFAPKDTSLDLAAWNSSDILLKQNWVEKLTFLLLALNFKISCPLTNK